MSAIDLDDYVAWLHARGIADEHLPLYREGAEAVVRQMAAGETEVRHDHIEAAAEIEAAMGASERRLANLRAIGARLQAYVAERSAPPMDGLPPDDEPALELVDVPRGQGRRARLARTSQQVAPVDGEARVRGTMVDDLAPPEQVGHDAVPAAMPPRAALAQAGAPVGTRPSVPAMPVPFTAGPRPGVLASPERAKRATLEERPLAGCVCRKRQEVYPDDYAAMWGKVYGFVAASIGATLWWVWNGTASLAVGMTVIALGAFASASTAGWKCTDCRRWIERSALDEDQRQNARTRMVIFAGVGVAATIVCVIAIQSLRSELARDRETRKVLDDLKTLDLDETGD